MIAVLLISVLMALTPDSVANRCRGEFSAGIPECACTVRNRLSAGWNPDLVLSAFYAPDVAATAEEVEMVRQILDKEISCNPDLYFMYSKADTVYLGIEHMTPVLVVTSGKKEVRFFPRWFR